MRRFFPVFAIGLFLASTSGFSAEVPGVKLATHRAVYEISLGKSSNGAVAAVSGRMALEFLDSCDGYVLNQRMLTELADPEGDQSISDFTIASWESRDGRKFRFKLRHQQSDSPTEEHVGSARLSTAGGAADMIKPKVEAIKLPSGTLFPTEHLSRLIDAARQGRGYFQTRVFDGSAQEGMYETGAFIGKPQIENNTAGTGREFLGGMRFWPVRISYFSYFTKEERPRYEISFKMYENGVSGDMQLDYEDFSMKVNLIKIEPMKASCG